VRIGGTMSAALGLMAALTAPPSSCAGTPATEINLAHGQVQDAETDPAAAAAAEFKRQAEALTGGTIRVNIFPGEQIGGNRDMTQLVGSGVIQSALVTVGGIDEKYPLIAVAMTPFAMPSIEMALAVYDGEFGRRLAADIESRTSLMVLGFVDTGSFYVLTNSQKPVRSPRDLAGLKMRTIPGIRILNDMIEGFGAQIVGVSSSQEFDAMAVGVIDGDSNPLATVLSRHYDQVQKYATLADALYAPYVWVFNRQAFDELTDEQRGAVRQAAAAAITRGHVVGRAHGASKEALGLLGRRLNVVVLSAAERRSWCLAARPVVVKALEKAFDGEGRALLDALLAAAQGPETKAEDCP
jgi:TRAP-type C4-dicarboxylate transport system substrate-binding protein